jgi:hypothetical protein
MPEFAQGLQLTVTDRDEFDEYVDENYEDPAIISESWYPNSVPEELYIDTFDFDDEFYSVIQKHVNGAITTCYLDSDLLLGAIEAGILEKDGYDREFVEENK